MSTDPAVEPTRSVELVARARSLHRPAHLGLWRGDYRWTCRCGEEEFNLSSATAAANAANCHVDEAILAALADRLLPPVVQTREEWRIVEDADDGFNVGSVNDDLDLTRQLLDVGRERDFWGASARIQSRTITTFADDGSPYGGATLTSAWREVSES